MGGTNFNQQIPLAGGADLPAGWTDSFAHSVYAHYTNFTYLDRKQKLWVYRGPNSGWPTLVAGTFDANKQVWLAKAAPATAVANVDFSYDVHVSRESQYLSLSSASTLPAWLKLTGMSLSGRPTAQDAGSNQFHFVLIDRKDNTNSGGRYEFDLAIQVTTNAASVVVGQAPLRIVSSNAVTGSTVEFTNRVPALAINPTGSNSFAMRLCYRNQPGFAWPGVSSPPAVGQVVPFLRRWNGQSYEGGPTDPTAGFPIVYRPYWPRARRGR